MPLALETAGEIAPAARRPRRGPSRARTRRRHDRERRLVGHRGEGGCDIRSRDDEFERRRAAADHRVVARDRDDRGIGDEDAGHVVLAVLEQRRRPDLDDAARRRPTPGTSTALRTHDARGARRAASPTALGGHELAGRDRARRDQSVVERVGREVGVADLPERDLDDLEVARR